MTFHTIVIVGHLGRDPELRYVPSGQAVANFNVATNRQWTNADGEQVKETIWFHVSAWGKLAETCATYLAKGRQVLVEGRLISDPKTNGPRVWTRQDGTPSAAFEVTASTVRFLGGRGDNGAEGTPAPVEEEETPF